MTQAKNEVYVTGARTPNQYEAVLDIRAPNKMAVIVRSGDSVQR